ncbi:glycosyltransferase family 4 protein [Aeromonas veronii]|uniref:glycosyltransferase family 4 protein n=1 Tax=Aeromonas veronii TaxID=654 RepID=UPI001CD6755A|nr:glycosyltransferase family 4 protein [Aeromonas veronii]UBR44318.1 glycosyltransferase family 4 protein [Aeromonas veronii]
MLKTIMIVAPGFYKMTGYYYRAIRDKDALERNGHRVEIISFKYPFFVDEDGNKIKYIECLKLLNSAEKLICENIAPSFLIMPFFKKHRIMVVHGSLEDLRPFKFYFFKKPLYKFLLSFALKYYDSIVSVSEAMEDYLIELNGHRKIHNLITIPNLPDNKFLDAVELAKKDQNLKRKLGLREDKKYICYCGNDQSWQKIDYLLDLFCVISKSTDDIDLIILTKEFGSFGEKIKQAKIDLTRIIIKTVENRLVPNYLVASDLLYIIRDQDMINKVACPTKAMEYLSSGTDLVISEGLGDITKTVLELNRGLVVKPSDDISCVSNKIIDYLSVEPSNNVGCYSVVKYRLGNYDEKYKAL